MMLFKLAFKNIKKSVSDYAIYFSHSISYNTVNEG